jgi:hypothetical protein
MALSGSLLALLLLSGAAPVPDKMPQTEYYPLTVGTTWTYERIGADGKRAEATIEVRVGAIEKIGGRDCARLDTIADDKVTQTEHLAVLDGGVYRCAYGGTAIEPPVLILKLPPTPGKVQTWPFNQKVAGDLVRGNFEQGEAEVTVPKAKGKAITVTGKNLRSGDATITMTTYYLPNFGPVKQYARINNLEVTLELKEFKLGKP